MNSDLDIFTYTDYQAFLRDYYDEQKRRNSAFSYRVFAELAGFSSHNTLKLVMSGQRHIGAKSISRFAMGLGLTQRQTEYFELMIRFAKSKREDEKRTVYERMQHIVAYRGIKRIDELQYGFYSTWYHPVIRELIATNQFDEDYKLMAKLLWPDIRPLQIQKSVELLLELGLIRRNESGVLVQTDRVIATDKEVSMLLHRSFSREMADLAKKSLEEVPADQREISSMTVSISPQAFRHVKNRIQEFKEELLRLIADDDQQSEMVYQFNFQFFPFLRRKSKKGSV